MDKKITLEKISDNIGVYISEEHRFGTDAVMLADFCAVKQSDIAIDLGTGTGIIPLRWLAGEHPPKIAAGVELSQFAFSLAQRASDEFTNGAFKVFNADMRDFSLPQGMPEATLVSCNPPYFKEGSGKQRGGEEFAARCEADLSLDSVAKCAYSLLKYGGRFCLCHRPDRIVDVFEAMRRNRIEPKKLQIVAAGKKGLPFLALIEGRKGGNSGITVLPEIKL